MHKQRHHHQVDPKWNLIEQDEEDLKKPSYFKKREHNHERRFSRQPRLDFNQSPIPFELVSKPILALP